MLKRESSLEIYKNHESSLHSGIKIQELSFNTKINLRGDLNDINFVSSINNVLNISLPQEPNTYSIYENIFKLNSGSLIKIKYRKGEWRTSDLEEIEWAKPFQTDHNLAEQILSIGESQTIDMLDNILTQAIDEYCISDVPIGAFLSGGIDSPVAAWHMMKQGCNVCFLHFQT